MLTDIFAQIEKGGATGTKQGGILHTGVSVLPQLPARRGRPQPDVAVRLHGKQVRIPRGRLGSVDRVPEHLPQRRGRRIARRLRRSSKPRCAAARSSRTPSAGSDPLIKEHKRIIFNGNGYAQEWQDEAAKRGL
jgi:glutamine synthetase